MDMRLQSINRQQQFSSEYMFEWYNYFISISNFNTCSLERSFKCLKIVINLPSHWRIKDKFGLHKVCSVWKFNPWRRCTAWCKETFHTYTGKKFSPEPNLVDCMGLNVCSCMRACSYLCMSLHWIALLYPASKPLNLCFCKCACSYTFAYLRIESSYPCMPAHWRLLYKVEMRSGHLQESSQ